MSAPAKPPAAEATASGARPDVALTARVKGHALGELGADLVGIADVGRFRNAPERMSPQGIMPDARSVVVMALHHPDGCVEMGGREHPQEIGPYRVQYWMNSVLDEISYRMALFLERSGFRAVPIASSNIWRYKGYRDMTENFAPDLSHMHAAVAAGLAEFGYSGLAITPEDGARQRYVTVVTDAVLAPSPLLEPGTVCDGCDLCVTHCMSGALSKEIDGENVVEIEGNRYTYARKNLWRCAWGEHFDLDLDLPIPERVDEDVILAAIEEHGFRGGEMGSCLRYCVPREQRYFDRRYTSAPRRRRPSPASATRSPAREIIEAARARGVDFAVVRSADDLSRAGIDLAGHLPDAASALTLGLHFAQPQGDDRLGHARRYVLEAAAFDAARALERLGHSSVCCTDLDAEPGSRAYCPAAPS